jgi:predicted nucleic acid-binding protein
LRLYLEPSVLVKLFKEETGSDSIIRLISLLDKGSPWYGSSSSWSLLEVARALKKDGKTKEMIELDLRELRSHKISFVPVSERILSDAERIVAETSLYASDAVHVSSYMNLASHSRLQGFLCEDVHYRRLKEHVPVKSINDLRL